MTQNMMRLAMVALAIGLASTVMVEAGARHQREDPLVLATYGLEQSARDAARHVTRGRRHVTYRQNRALRQLVELQRETRQFRRDLWRYGARSATVRRDRRHLHRAFREARFALRAHRPNGWVRKDLARITRAMQRLDRAYETRLAYQRNPRRAYPIDRHAPALYGRSGNGPDRNRAVVGRARSD